MQRKKQHGTSHEGHACGCGHHGAAQHTTGLAALDILDERFARGEIDKAEYEEKKQLISQRPTLATADAASPPQAASAKSAPTKR